MSASRSQRLTALARAASLVPKAERAAFLRDLSAGREDDLSLVEEAVRLAEQRDARAAAADDDDAPTLHGGGSPPDALERTRAGDPSSIGAPAPGEDATRPGGVGDADATKASGAFSPRAGFVAQRFEGRTIGPYTIARPLGEGGMGLVFVAEQHEPIRRLIALKLIRPELASGSVLARFEAERQALALMNHRHVARVFDAGTTEEGSPWFAMEYVEGQPLTDYCREKELGLEGRLALFLQVCAGVQHAHQKGIVHRDLKPSNILVALEDDEPTVKIIDFGIARALDPGTTGIEGVTEMGQIVGTPEYMSPEQADLAHLDVDTRTDVYALGVLLYELLTGVLPFDARRLRTAGFAEIRRIIREEEPSRPSQRGRTILRTMAAERTRGAVGGEKTAGSAAEQPTRARSGAPDGETAATRGKGDDDAPATRVSAARPANAPSEAPAAVDAPAPRTLAPGDPRRLAGDLDWITMKALEKEPERRYVSVSALAADLQRHLDDLPVVAGPPSRAYRARKFVRRHRLGVSVAAAIALTLVFGVIGTGVGLVRALEAERLARFEAETASEVSEFLVGLFRISDPSEARGNVVTAREILDRGVASIGDEFGERPAMRSRLSEVMGRVYRSLGLHAEAQPLLESAVADARAAHGDESLEVAAALNSLAGMHLLRGQASEARPLLEEAIAIQRARLASDDPERARTLNNLGLALRFEGDLDAALATLEEALSIRRAALGPEHPDVAKQLLNVGSIQRRLGRPEEAVASYREALAIREKLLAPNHPQIASTLNNLATAERQLGRLDQARSHAERALSIRRETLGEAHPEIALALSNLGAVELEAGRLDEALARFEEAVAVAEESAGPGHRAWRIAMRGLAQAHRERGEGEEAAKVEERSAAASR